MTGGDAGLGTWRERLRPAQAQALAYTGGPLAISAVPGAGKTFILTRLAARLIAELGASPSQILIVTFMRSAARTFRDRIALVLADQGLGAYGLQACTIHAFCLSVVQRQAQLAGEEEGWATLPPGETRGILKRALAGYLEEPVRRADWERRNPPGASRFDDPLVQTVEAAFDVLATAKHRGLAHGQVAEALAGLDYPELAYMVGLYEDVLAERRALDFDDQVRQAIALLERHEPLLRYYRDRYRYVLEDEAQDSTPAQNRLLALLTGEGGNWIRVGDPNQSITGTFTFTDPRFFRGFCRAHEPGGRHVTMNESSRSGTAILAVANRLVALAREHPDPLVAAAFEPVAIVEATAGPSNPPAEACSVRFSAYATADAERIETLRQVRSHLGQHPDQRLAVLCHNNDLVAKFVGLFALADLPVHVSGSDPAQGDRVLNLVVHVLACLALPDGQLASAVLAALEAWRSLAGLSPSAALRRWIGAKGFDAGPWLFPAEGLPPPRPNGLDEAEYAGAVRFMRSLGTLFAQRHRPPYDLIAAIARVLVVEGPALDAAHRIAGLVRQALRSGGELTGPEEAWAERRLPDVQDVWRVARDLRDGQGSRSLLTHGEEVTPALPGHIQVLTLHKAKGMEFDAVWIPELGCYNLPRKGVLGRFPWRLEEVNLLGLKGLVAKAAVDRYAAGEPFDEAAILHAARQATVAERLRLLYVGITRAQKFLTLSCATYEGKTDPPAHIQALARWCQ